MAERKKKTGELIFEDGVKQVAKWAHLKQLYSFESERLVKLSDLNEISIAPKPIEMQQVSTCLSGEIEESGMADHIWKEKGNHLPLWDKVEIIDRAEHWRIR